MAADKRSLRLRFREVLVRQSSTDLLAWNERIGEHLSTLSASFPPQGFVAAYRARPAEASPQGLFREPLRFCFPVVVGAHLEWREVKKPLDPRSFAPGFKGIEEPLPAHPLVNVPEIAVCLVPLLAFDEHGGRLGNGKGYYDRFLAGFRGWRVGVAFECQRAGERLPMEGHDERLEMVVTETGVRRF